MKEAAFHEGTAYLDTKEAVNIHLDAQPLSRVHFQQGNELCVKLAVS